MGRTTNQRLSEEFYRLHQIGEYEIVSRRVEHGFNIIEIYAPGKDRKNMESYANLFLDHPGHFDATKKKSRKEGKEETWVWVSERKNQDGTWVWASFI